MAGPLKKGAIPTAGRSVLKPSFVFMVAEDVIITLAVIKHGIL